MIRLACCLAVIGFGCWLGPAAAAQAAGTPGSGAGGAAAGSLVQGAEAYRPDEFPPLAMAFRRFEIISIGVFPFALFYTRTAFDLQRYLANNLEGSYAPWPFKNERSYKPTDDEQKRSVLIAAGVSLLFAGADAVLRHLLPRDN